MGEGEVEVVVVIFQVMMEEEAYQVDEEARWMPLEEGEVEVVVVLQVVMEEERYQVVVLVVEDVERDFHLVVVKVEVVAEASDVVYVSQFHWESCETLYELLLR